MDNDADYIIVAKEQDLGASGQKTVTVGGKSILLCLSEGQYFAVRNSCTHDMEPLQGGVVRKCTIVCPMHGARFNLRNGQPFGPPAFEPLETYDVRIHDGQILVSLKPKS